MFIIHIGLALRIRARPILKLYSHDYSLNCIPLGSITNKISSSRLQTEFDDMEFYYQWIIKITISEERKKEE